jgi:hypothetical protein
MRNRTKIIGIVAIIGLLGASLAVQSPADVIRQDDRVFIVDRTGEHWDVTQAVSIGFDPHDFQFGIGRNAIRPLDESHLRDNALVLDPGERVIGVENDNEAHAYVIRKLTRHEIANTRIGGEPIAAAY